MQLLELTRALDAAFSERLALFDDSMLRSTAAIDNAVSEKARAFTFAMENHVRALSDTLGQQVHTIDQSMVSGIDAVRRTSDSITRQSLKAIEGLHSQADMLRGVSENVAQQISGVTNRFDDHGQSIVNAASALEGATMRIDSTLQKRQQALNDQLRALEQLSSLSARERRDVTPPGPLAPGAPLSLTAAYAAQAAAAPPPPLQAPPPDHGERWSLGDLLARASRDDDGTTRA